MQNNIFTPILKKLTGTRDVLVLVGTLLHCMHRHTFPNTVNGCPTEELMNDDSALFEVPGICDCVI